MLYSAHEISCLVVVYHEKPVGILTERDMLKRIMCESRQPRSGKVVNSKSKPLITASPDMLAGDATKLMFERNIKKLPVVENGRLVGLVTLTDIPRSPTVIEFPNRLSLDGTSRRIKKVINLVLLSAETTLENMPVRNSRWLFNGLSEHEVYVVGRRRMCRHQAFSTNLNGRIMRGRHGSGKHVRRPNKFIVLDRESHCRLRLWKRLVFQNPSVSLGDSYQND